MPSRDKDVMPLNNWKIGCVGFPLARGEYFRKFDAVEVQETFYDPPAARVLARWRREAPENFSFAMRAWQLITHPPSFRGYARIQSRRSRSLEGLFGHFLPGKDVDWAWSVTREAAEALQAEAIVFRSPPSFSSTVENLKNLEDFFSRIDRGKFRLVWDPEGLWSEQEVERLCERLDLTPAVDPLVSLPPRGTFFFCRLMRPKQRRSGRYTEDDFARIVDRLTKEASLEDARGMLIFDTPNCPGDAHRFRKWLGERFA